MDSAARATVSHPPPRWRKTLWLVVRVAASVGLLAWLIHTFDWEHISAELVRLPWWAWLLGWLSYLATQATTARRWQLAARLLEVRAPYPTFLGLTYLGMFGNLFLPSSMGGDVVRVAALASQTGQTARALLSVYLERLSGLGAMLGLGAVASLWPAGRDWGWLALGLWGGTLGLLGLLVASGPLLKRVPKLPGKLERVAETLRTVHLPWVGLGEVLLLGVVVQLGNMVLGAWLGWHLGLQLDFAFYMTTLAVVTLLTLLPISFHGVGVREAGFTLCFAVAGQPAPVAVALSVLFFSIMVASSLLGAIPLAVGRLRRPTAHP